MNKQPEGKKISFRMPVFPVCMHCVAWAPLQSSSLYLKFVFLLCLQSFWVSCSLLPFESHNNFFTGKAKQRIQTIQKLSSASLKTCITCYLLHTQVRITVLFFLLILCTDWLFGNIKWDYIWDFLSFSVIAMILGDFIHLFPENSQGFINNSFSGTQWV